MGQRSLSPDEAALWVRVMAGVRPIARRPAEPAPRTTTVTPAGPAVASSGAGPAARVRPAVGAAKPGSPAKPAPTARTVRMHPATPSNTLDGTWDRRLSRGLVSPDRTVDLHGHTLASAYDMLDAALAMAIRSGDRMILLVTGKPPRPASERPHARGAIRAATGDWLAGSRHAAAIAAVRAAHPRHGGAGALYIVLKRSRLSGTP